MNEFTKHMNRTRKIWSVNKAEEVITKYEYLQDFIDNDYGCYLYIKKNKLEHLIKHLKYKIKKSLNN